MKKVAAFLMFIPLFFWFGAEKHTPELTITSNKTNKILWTMPVEVGDRFTIRFTHSVERTEVDEVIRIGDGNLVIDSTIYESFGAGLPFDIEGEQKMRMEDGKVIIENINREIPVMDLFIGQVIANHTLIIKGEEIPLKDLSEPGTSLRFSVTNKSRVQSFFRRLVQFE
ncbi:hypothetical protein A8F94_15575 [Bacillus sp. FJAT-27225]|uniref:DUF1850 domain-containing protein n=1 Tax=Bacillus sp. FJAT-27225 TaxID=1743144 RepID=UPI00080C31A4|nr:DUF1850 domain-containing protein [Bacillus sp. FJAT-27225]OCA84141.1 hypothetical protein A8F94_15575 [Bacillus sp. FJAT-27225]